MMFFLSTTLFISHMALVLFWCFVIKHMLVIHYYGVFLMLYEAKVLRTTLVPLFNFQSCIPPQKLLITPESKSPPSSILHKQTDTDLKSYVQQKKKASARHSLLFDITKLCWSVRTITSCAISLTLHPSVILSCMVVCLTAKQAHPLQQGEQAVIFKAVFS